LKQRTERLSREIQAILGEALARGDVKDPRVREAGLVTITRVRVTGDLREARVAFAVFGAVDAVLERAQAGLQSAASHLQREIGHQLRTRNTPTLTFEIDRVLDEALRVDSILRTVSAELRSSAATAEAPADPPAEAEPGGEGADPPRAVGGPDTEK
jgi:ribosome-binding factor A